MNWAKPPQENRRSMLPGRNAGWGPALRTGRTVSEGGVKKTNGISQHPNFDF